MGETAFTEELALAIQGDLMKILTTMATKEDLREIWEEMADMKKVMATKEDIRQIREEMADMKKVMATKEDLNKLHDKLAIEINHGDQALKTDRRLIRLERQATI